MTEMQSKLLEMIKWVDRFCHENEVTYFAMGGTILGAVRHKGFIPWDDDIDIGVPRPDYDRLISLIKNNPDKNCPFTIECPLDSKDYIYTYAKIYDTRTTLIEKGRYPLKRGVFIDVFPLDGIGQTKEEGVKNAKKIDKVTRRFRALTYTTKPEDKLLKKLYYFGLRMLSPFMASKEKLLKKVEKICKQRSYYEQEFVGNMVESWGQRKVMSKEVYGTPVRLQFEDTMLCMPEGYEKYLVHMYKNYMQLPPEDKRVTQHNYLLLDLNKSYLEE